MTPIRISLQIKSFVSGIRAFFNAYKKRVIAAGGYIEGEQCAIDKFSTNNLLKQASWVLIPEGIKEDVVYAQKPTDGLGDLNFTRSSDATYTDSTGAVRRSPYNLVTYSEDFTNVAWTKVRTTITVDSIVAPNGTQTADTLIGNGVSGTHYINHIGYNVVAGVSYSISIYAKKNTNNFIQLDISGAAFGSNRYANFDLNNGTIGTVGAGTTASIQSVGDGWYRCVISRVSFATTTAPVYIALITNSNSIAFETNTLSTSVFLWGAQVTEGTEALDYFPTTDRQNVPRIDFRNADGTLSSCGRLLLEPQRTNSIRNSTMVGAVAGSPGTLPTNWVVLGAGGLTRTIVGTGIENGVQYIDLRLNGIATGTSFVISTDSNGTIAASAGQVWSQSTYFKTISVPNPPLAYSIVSYYWNTGVFVNEARTAFTPNTTLSRYTATHTIPAGATTNIVHSYRFDLTIAATYDFTIRIAAPQMELGAYATTFIPTTTAAVTRLADAASKTGISSLIGQTEGTMFAEVDLRSTSSTKRILYLSDGTINNEIRITSNAISVGDIQYAVRVAGALVVNSFTPTNVYTNGVFKIAAAYSLDDFILYINGVQLITDTSGTVPACSRIDVGSQLGTSNFLDDRISQAALFPTRLTNAQLEEITTL